jgi:hypothetical protein
MLVPSEHRERGTSLIRVLMLVPSSGESHYLLRKGYQQDALFAVNKDELSPVNEVHRERGTSLIRGLFTCALE